MVASHVVEAVAEPAVAVEEGAVLGVDADRGEVALGDDGRRLDGRRSRSRRRRFMTCGCGRLAVDLQDRALLGLRLVEDAALDLAEVDVVDGGEPAQQLAVGPGQRADAHAGELVIGGWREAVEAVDRRAVVQHDEVVGDRGDLDGHGGDQYQGRSRRAATGLLHHRPLNRHRGVRPSTAATCTTGRGQTASTAAKIAATSSSEAGRTTITGADSSAPVNEARRREHVRSDGVHGRAWPAAAREAPATSRSRALGEPKRSPPSRAEPSERHVPVLAAGQLLALGAQHGRGRR